MAWGGEVGGGGAGVVEVWLMRHGVTVIRKEVSSGELDVSKGLGFRLGLGLQLGLGLG